VGVAIVEPVALGSPRFVVHLFPFLDWIHPNFDVGSLQHAMFGAGRRFRPASSVSFSHGSKARDDPVFALPIERFLAAKRHLEVVHSRQRNVALANFQIVPVDDLPGRIIRSIVQSRGRGFHRQ